MKVQHRRDDERNDEDLRDGEAATAQLSGQLNSGNSLTHISYECKGAISLTMVFTDQGIFFTHKVAE